MYYVERAGQLYLAEHILRHKWGQSAEQILRDLWGEAGYAVEEVLAARECCSAVETYLDCGVTACGARWDTGNTQSSAVRVLADAAADNPAAIIALRSQFLLHPLC